LKKLFLVVLLLLFVSPVLLSQQPTAKLSPEVDERVELLSVVFRLAGNFEYNMSKLDRYTGDIDRQFGPFKTHPAVVMAKKLADENGVGFDAVMFMAISLSKPPELQPLVPFSGTVPESRWGSKENALQFASLLRQFYTDTHFEAFFQAHRALYALAEQRFAATLTNIHVNWFSTFYGMPTPAKFRVIIGLNDGGANYGPRLVKPDGTQEFYAIMGSWTKDAEGDPTFDRSYLPTVIHEFNHSFINPLVESRFTEFKGLQTVYDAVGTTMKQNAYGNTKVMLQESLVRACVVLYLKENSSTDVEVQNQIVEEEKKGFIWTPDLVALLQTYTSQRGQYRTLVDFMPQIETFFGALGARMPTLMEQAPKASGSQSL
jgi:hypothetical protein